MGESGKGKGGKEKRRVECSGQKKIAEEEEEEDEEDEEDEGREGKEGRSPEGVRECRCGGCARPRW